MVTKIRCTCGQLLLDSTGSIAPQAYVACPVCGESKEFQDFDVEGYEDSKVEPRFLDDINEEEFEVDDDGSDECEELDFN